MITELCVSRVDVRDLGTVLTEIFHHFGLRDREMIVDSGLTRETEVFRLNVRSSYFGIVVEESRS